METPSVGITGLLVGYQSTERFANSRFKALAGRALERNQS